MTAVAIVMDFNVIEYVGTRHVTGLADPLTDSFFFQNTKKNLPQRYTNNCRADSGWALNDGLDRAFASHRCDIVNSESECVTTRLLGSFVDDYQLAGWAIGCFVFRGGQIKC